MIWLKFQGVRFVAVYVYKHIYEILLNLFLLYNAENCLKELDIIKNLF